MQAHQYAQHILTINTLQARRDYLNNAVPEHLRELVKTYVKNWHALKKSKRKLSTENVNNPCN